MRIFLTAICVIMLGVVLMSAGASADSLAGPASVKLRPDGDFVVMSGAVISASLWDTSYAQLGACGIRVDWLDPLAPGCRYFIQGLMDTAETGERRIWAISVIPDTCGDAPSPLGMPNKSIGGGDWHYDEMTGAGQMGVTGGFGLNNIGLLVKTWGRVSRVHDYAIDIDDGSDAPVRCDLPPGVSVDDEWEYVAVTGVSSCYWDEDGIKRCIVVRGEEDIDVLVSAPPVHVDLLPMTINWDPASYNHGQTVMEYLIFRDGLPYKSLRDPSAIDRGKTGLLTTITGQPYYGDSGATYTVNYYQLDSNPSANGPIDVSTAVNQEPFGTTNTYDMRVCYRQTSGGVTTYHYSPLSNPIVATAIDLVKRDDMVYPPTGEEVLVPNLIDFTDRFEWNSKDGADLYLMSVKPMPGDTGPTWTSPLIYATGGSTVKLPESLQTALASLLNNPAYQGQSFIWRIDARSSSDTSQACVTGEDNWFVIVCGPPGP